MVNVGVIGLGANWDSLYAPVLYKHRDRICVRALFDPISDRADIAAAQWNAYPVYGVLPLVNRKDVRAVLILDTAWHGLATLEFACKAHKPAYIAGRLGGDVKRLARIHEAARAEGLTLMPEMPLRHAPSTVRLHELMATQLGPPRHVVIEAAAAHPGDDSPADVEQANEFLATLVDWCHYVVRTAIVRVEMTGNQAEAVTEVLTMQFGTSRPTDAAVVAEIRLQPAAAEQAGAGVGVPQIHCEVRCERGSAVIDAPDSIAWKTSTKSPSEKLTSDRPAVEVMIDHFCRRAAGGLIPVPDLSDVCRALEVVGAARQSQWENKPIAVNVRG